MTAIASKMFLWLVIAAGLGFVWAWLWRGARDRQSHSRFFSEWKLRYDQMEADYHAQSAEIEGLKREFAVQQELLRQYRARAEQPT